MPVIPRACAGYSLTRRDAGLWCTFGRWAKIAHFSKTSTSCKNRPPNRGQSGVFEVHAGEIELAFANAMHQFDAGEDNGGAAEPLEPEHHVHPRFDVAVILLNQVIQVLRGSQFRSPG